MQSFNSVRDNNCDNEIPLRFLPQAYKISETYFGCIKCLNFFFK